MNDVVSEMYCAVSDSLSGRVTATSAIGCPHVLLSTNVTLLGSLHAHTSHQHANRYLGHLSTRAAG